MKGGNVIKSPRAQFSEQDDSSYSSIGKGEIFNPLQTQVSIRDRISRISASMKANSDKGYYYYRVKVRDEYLSDYLKLSDEFISSSKILEATNDITIVYFDNNKNQIRQEKIQVI